jgi:starch phosphorylase
VAILSVRDDAEPVIARGAKIKVEVTARLAGLSPDEVTVECYRGPLSSKGEIEFPERTVMVPEMSERDQADGVWTFSAVVNGSKTGQIGYSIRILPQHPALGDRLVPGLVRWA